MISDVVIRAVRLPLEGLDRLRADAHADGHMIVDRLVDDWGSGANRFDRAGELLLGAYSEMQLAGIGGLNLDPYARDDACGRLRHIAVARSQRRKGVGRALVGALIDGATVFDRIRLRTFSADAAALYEGMGFGRIADPFATHELRLGPRAIRRAAFSVRPP